MHRISNSPIAISTWVWHSPLRGSILAQRLAAIAGWGFDAVEMPYEKFGDWDPIQARDLLQEHSLTSMVGCVFSPGRELADAPDDVILGTKDYVRQCVDLAVAQGASLVVGPIYTSVGRTGRIEKDKRRETVAELERNLAELADYAGERGVLLGVEPLNRYETSLINTAAQLMEIIDALPEDAIGVTLDTYHMNIEERSWKDAFRLVGDRLVHLQVCANDRGVPGRDHVNWVEIGEVLAEIEYCGPLGIESFTSENETMATAASIWRPLAASQDAIATEGHAFISEWRDRWLGR